MVTELVSGDQYNDLFLAPASHPFLLVDKAIWERVKANLPKDYFIPDYRIINHLKHM